MRNVTITLDEETARWLRLEAAERNTSVSRLVGTLLRERMTSEHSYESAMDQYLKRKPRRLGTDSGLPSREEIHDRRRLR